MIMQVEPAVAVGVMEVEEPVQTVVQPRLVDKALVAPLVGDAQRHGLDVAGEDGLLAQLTKLVLEAALEGELTAQVGG